ncbi:hypothetical protein ZWY2020_012438 [Hordeum vulgare]|nr:hypothetical protein ZWY2020_012438 [Hordeum vulgare]
MEFAATLRMILLHVLVAGVLASNTTSIPSYHCGDRLSIRYPFWIDMGDIWRCGHPSLRLESRGHTPVLRLPSGDYAVTDILYGNAVDSDRRVTLHDLGVFS